MGIFDRFRKKEEPPEESIKLDISQFQKWFNKRFSDKIIQAKSKAKDIYNNIMASFSDIRDSTKALERAVFESDDRTASAANMAKDYFVKKTFSLINIQGISQFDYKSLNDFHKTLTNILDDLKNTSPKQAILLSRCFKDESSAVIDNIKKVEKHAKSLKEFLDSDARIMQLVLEISNSTKEQTELVKSLKLKERGQRDIQIRIKELVQEKKSADSQLSDILKNPAWNELKNLQLKTEKLEKKILDTENSVNEEISAMRRPFRKLQYLLGTKPLPENPFRAIILKDNENFLLDILVKIEKFTEEQKISLKQKEREKIANLMAKMKSEIPELKKRYLELVSQKEKMEKEKTQYSDLIKTKKALENKMENISDRIDSLKGEAGNIAKEIESLSQEVSKKKSDLENIVFKNTGVKVSLK